MRSKFNEQTGEIEYDNGLTQTAADALYQPLIFDGGNSSTTLWDMIYNLSNSNNLEADLIISSGASL